MPYAKVFLAFANNLESLIAQGGYAFLLIFTLFEGIPLLGMFIPGHVAVIIAGFLAKIGTLNLGYVLAVSIFGAILGDFMGFSLGRKYGMAFIDRWRPYFFISDAHIEKARDLINKHTGMAMIIGRFTPATRALMPFLVGSSNTSSGRFWFFNVIGGISWVVVSVFVGYIFGAGYHLAAAYLGKIFIFGLLGAILIVWGYRFVNSRFSIFRKYEVITLLLNILSLAALAATIEKLVDRSFELNFDVWVNAYMERLASSHGLLATVSAAVSFLGSPAFISLVAIAFCIYFIFRNKWRSAAVMFISLGLTLFAGGIMKELFLSPRPTNAIQLLIDNPSFPSLHAAAAAAFFLVFAYLFAPRVHSWVKRELMIALCVIIAIIIGLSRLVLNVHWASDVVGGWALGVFSATAAILFVRYIGALVVRKDQGHSL